MFVILIGVCAFVVPVGVCAFVVPVCVRVFIVPVGIRVFIIPIDVGAFVLTGGVVLLVMVVLARSSFNPLAFRSLLYLVALAPLSLCLMVAAL